MFKGIARSANRKLVSLKGAAEFSAAVQTAVKLMYRAGAPRVRDAIFSRESRRASIAVSTAEGARTLGRDREVIRAALRREGFDVRELTIRTANRS